MQHQQIPFKHITRQPDSFYKHVYPVLSMSKNQLIDLSHLSSDHQIIAVDSCGWFYQEHYPNLKFYNVESLYMVKNVSMDRSKFDKLYNDKDDIHPSFPKVSFEKSVLILDNTVLFRYREIENFKTVFENLLCCTNPELVYFRGTTKLTGEFRFSNRVQGLTQVVPDTYTIEKFLFDAAGSINSFQINLRKIKKYASSIN